MAGRAKLKPIEASALAQVETLCANATSVVERMEAVA